MMNDPNVSRRNFIQQLSLFGVAGLGGSALLSACGGKEESKTGSAAQAATTATQSGPADITITPVGNQMKFEQTELTVRPGQEVHLTFDNTATSPAMQHNVIVLDTSDDAVVKEVAQAAQTAGASNDYIPDHEAVLAATALAEPGETVETSFTAPEQAGDCTYVCTFPGHWVTMQGTMHVAS